MPMLFHCHECDKPTISKNLLCDDCCEETKGTRRYNIKSTYKNLIKKNKISQNSPAMLRYIELQKKDFKLED